MAWSCSKLNESQSNNTTKCQELHEQEQTPDSVRVLYAFDTLRIL